MMVLLIIFMVTAPMMESGLDVELPQAKQVDTLPSDAKQLVLTVRDDGALFLDTYEVKLEELEERLTLLVKEKDRALFLQADKAVPYGVVVDVMGRIKAAGIENDGAHRAMSDAMATAKLCVASMAKIK